MSEYSHSLSWAVRTAAPARMRRPIFHNAELWVLPAVAAGFVTADPVRVAISRTDMPAARSERIIFRGGEQPAGGGVMMGVTE